MRKFLFLITLLTLMGGANSYATRKLNVDLSAMAASAGEAMWDKDTKTFSWKAKWSNSIALPDLKGNLCEYSAISFVTSAQTCDHFRIIVYLTNGVQKTWSGNVGTTSVTFASLGLKQEDLTSVSSINISGASDGEPSAGSPLSIIVTSISLEGPDDCPIIASTIYKKPEGSTSKLEDLSGNYPSYQKWPDTFHYFETIGGSTVFCGNGDGSSESSHVDLGGADYICFDVIEVTSGGAPLRVWVWDGSAVQTIYAKPIADYATADYSSSTSISSVGTYVAKVTGYNDLKGIKTASGASGSIKISLAYTCSGAPIAYVPTRAYKLYGESTGDASLTAALADADACYYDATSVIGTGVDLTSVANKNALFKANADVLTNTKNVIVGSTCANLVLTDGNYPFKALEAFTATAAKFTKTVSEADYATMVIPFAVATLPEGVEAYNLTGVTGESITYSTAATIAADKPVLIKATEGTYNFEASGVAVAATADGVVANGLLNGTYATTTAAAGANNYVLQKNGDDVNFYLVKGTDATVKPFRAYLKASGAGARALNLDLGETTGIETVKKADVSTAVYSLSGQRVAAPQKGLYIVNGKKVIVK